MIPGAPKRSLFAGCQCIRNLWSIWKELYNQSKEECNKESWSNKQLFHVKIIVFVIIMCTWNTVYQCLSLLCLWFVHLIIIFAWSIQGWHNQPNDKIMLSIEMTQCPPYAWKNVGKISLLWKMSLPKKKGHKWSYFNGGLCYMMFVQTLALNQLKKKKK